MNLHWLKTYQPRFLWEDLRIGIFATLILIPQALAYAAIANLPPYFGLYASLLPLIVYALLGSSPVLSVGPVAIISLMTASALAPLALAGEQYIQAASFLTLLCGILLLLFAALRLGALAYLLSQPVISGFISGAALIIMISQLQPLLGINVASDKPIAILYALSLQWQQANPLAATLGLASVLLLFLAVFFLALYSLY